MKTSKPLIAGIFGATLWFSFLAIAAPPIPSEVQMVQPDSSLPKGLRSFWGKWEGRGFDYGQGKEIEFFVIFEKITEKEASLFTWHTVHGWSPRREAKVTRQGGEYKLSYKGPFGTNEMGLQGDELVFDAQREGKSSWFTLKLKRIP